MLMPGRKICVVTANVNQHTDHGLLTFPLATDFAVLLRNVGFVMINEIIWSKNGTGGKWGSYGSQRPIFGSYPYPPNFLFKNVHEYVLVFAKPRETKTKGPKVRLYTDLMADMEQVVNGSMNGHQSLSVIPSRSYSVKEEICMEIAFRIQDPTRTDTTYLYEAILRAAQGASTWRGRVRIRLSGWRELALPGLSNRPTDHQWRRG